MHRRWFISHPSGGQNNTPVFFNALEEFARDMPKIEFILPHEMGDKIQLTKTAIEQCDLVLAEVSIPSTGSGIELGWASAAQKPVIAFHQGTSVISPSVQFVATAIHTYLTQKDIIKVLKTLV